MTKLEKAKTYKRIYDRLYDESNECDNRTQSYNEETQHLMQSIKEMYEDLMENNKIKFGNVHCPKCGKLLYASDIIDYSYVCYNCEENFYGVETDQECCWYTK